MFNNTIYFTLVYFYHYKHVVFLPQNLLRVSCLNNYIISGTKGEFSLNALKLCGTTLSKISTLIIGE